MSWDAFTDGAMRLLENTLTWRTRNQEVISGNIANLDTPGYNRKEMDFQQILHRYSQGNVQEVKLDLTNAAHLPGADPGAGLIQETWEPVDLDLEMVSMAENTISYQTSVQMLIKKLSFLRTVIDGEGG